MRNYTNILVFLMLLFLTLSGSGCDSSSTGENDPNGSGGCDCTYGCNDDGSCKLQPCETSTDCPSGYICVGGVCNNNSPDGDSSNGLPDGDDDTVGENNTTPPQTDGDVDSDRKYDVDFETDVPHSEDNPWIYVDPNRVDFGAVPLNTKRTKELHVGNKGKGQLIIDSMYLYYEKDENVQELVVRAGLFPIRLNKDEESTIFIDFTAHDMNPDFDLLVISSNDPSEPNIGVDITTEIKAYGELEITPEEIKFGMARVGNYARDVDIKNIGGLDSTIYEIRLESATPEYSLEGVPSGLNPNSPYKLSPHTTLNIRVKYDPILADGSIKKATLHIQTSDPNYMKHEIPISASTCDPEIEILPTALDFNGVDYGQEKTQCATIKNTGCWMLNVKDLKITDDADGSYTWDPKPEIPKLLGENEEMTACVHFIPTISLDNIGIMEVKSNDADEEITEVLLTSDTLPSDIDCEPKRLDFIDVPVGKTMKQTIACKNLAPRILELDSVTIDAAGGIYTITNTPPKKVNYKGTALIDVEYAPTDEGEQGSEVTILSNDPDEEQTIIPIRGTSYIANVCPVAQIAVTSPPVTEIKKMDTVDLDGSGSYDDDTGDSIKAYKWEVKQAPAGSISTISDPVADKPTFYVDREGTYIITLEVYDQLDTPSCEKAVFEFTAGSPPPNIVCAPTNVDFGSVNVGQMKPNYDVECRNTGHTVLNISKYEIVDAENVFTLGNTPKQALGYDESDFVKLVFTPNGVDTYQGALKIHSDDPDTPIVEITLDGKGFTGNQCPVAVAEVKDPPGGTGVMQYNTVTLSGAKSSDPDAGDVVDSYIWNIVSKPSGSQSYVTPFGVEEPTMYIDKAGTYEVSLRVKDDHSTISCNTDTVSFTAVVPPPKIICTPTIINYGAVPINTQQVEVVTCRNEGLGPLSISKLDIVNPVYSVSNAPAMNIPSNGATTIDVKYSPTATGTNNGKLVVKSDDPNNGTLEISLTGGSYDPNTCPNAVIKASLNGSPDLSVLEPLDTIYFDGSNSNDPDAGDIIYEYAWSIVTRPSGSTSNLNGSNTAKPNLFVDLAGDYKVRLIVRDNHGKPSCTPAEISFTAIPREKIHVQLVWNTSEGDFDLHLIKPSSSIWSSSGDCYFDNESPNWGSYGRPSLDIDKQHGWGPENINLDDPSNGTYRVYAHYWNTWGESSTVQVTVRIYLWGVLKATKTMSWPSNREHYRWKVADINWNGASSTISGFSTTLESDGHGD